TAQREHSAPRPLRPQEGAEGLQHAHGRMEMTDYKLVPIDPAPEMVEAAEDAYMPFGDMEMAIRMALLAAPAVQGEPVGWQFYQDGKWWNGDDRIKDHRKNTEEAGYPIREVYAAPQP